MGSPGIFSYCRTPLLAEQKMMAIVPMPQVQKNRLLARLPEEDQEHLLKHLEPLTLTYKQPLYHAHKRIDFVYFIESGVASLVNSMNEGAEVEVGTVGNEGLVGLPIVLGNAISLTNAYMQVPGQGLRIKARAFQDAIERSHALRTLMLRYANAYFNQMAQSTACAHFHSVRQRCCRWLLATHDRMPTDEFPLSQEFLAMMLGVTREHLSKVEAALRRSSIIRYRQKCITILDRARLENRACECYAIIRAEWDNLLGDRVTETPDARRPDRARLLTLA